MTVPVFLYGALAAHRRGKVLRETLAAEGATSLPQGRAVLVSFAETFQSADASEQTRLVEWTRTPGHLLVLVPPFAPGPCERPVSWWAERLERAPRGGDGLAKVLAPEVTHRLDGRLQTPPVPGATWSDLSVCIGTHRLHPAAGLFAVTCLPLWSLAVLDAPDEGSRWLDALVALAGEGTAVERPAERELSPEHYGLLVFLLSEQFSDEEQCLAALRSSSIFRIATERARSLLGDLHELGHVVGAAPTAAARALVERSPYAFYLNALREVSPR